MHDTFMAIIIEEEKRTSGILNILGWLAVLSMVGAAIYYIFLVSPITAIILPSAGLNNIGPISQVNLNAQNILNSNEFQALKQYVSPTSTFGSVPVGRANPFVAP
jgi:hypothetical protein